MQAYMMPTTKVFSLSSLMLTRLAFKAWQADCAVDWSAVAVET